MVTGGIWGLLGGRLDFGKKTNSSFYLLVRVRSLSCIVG